MQDPDPRPPLLPLPVVRGAKILMGILASSIALVGGVITFGVAGLELLHAVGEMFGPEASPERAIVLVVQSIDAVLLGLVQFLLGAFLWQILDPKESLLDDENMERLEEAKQILCKVVLVIVAVRMLSVLVTPADLRWEHLVYPAGIVALSFATTSLQKSGKPGGSSRA
jgi:uncharacterized membrane protein YqhA